MSIPLEAGALMLALAEKRITPSLFLDFLVITFQEGYVALGGFNQLEYLPLMQAAHVKSLKEIGRDETARIFAGRVTDGLICGLFPFDFGSSIDMMWHYNSTAGRFNGNLDRGLSRDDVAAIAGMKVRTMIGSAITTMMDSVGF